MYRKHNLLNVLYGIITILALHLSPVTSHGEASSAGGTIPPKYAAADFAAQDSIGMPVLSPSGRYTASLASIKGKEKLLIIDVQETDPAKQTKLLELGNDLGFRWVRWLSDEKLAVNYGRAVPFLGAEMLVTRFMIMNRDGRSVRIVAENFPDSDGDNVIYWAPDGKYMLMTLYQKTKPRGVGVSRIDTITNEITEVQAPVEDIDYWIVDEKGLVRAGYGYIRGSRRLKIIYRDGATEDFRILGKFRTDENKESRYSIVGFKPKDGKAVVISDEPTGRLALYDFDIQSQTLGPPLWSSDKYDIEDFDLTSEGELRGVTFFGEKLQVKWFDSALGRLQNSLDKALPNRVNVISSRSRDQKKFLVASSSGNDPGSIYYYDKEKGQMSLLSPVNERLDGKILAPVKHITYKARDGLEIPAYLTLPVGRAPEKLPLIVYPHGGPYVRDTGDYDPVVQFLANRGYAVLQPNFRGSTGYGKTFEEKAHGQWGLSMQSDIDDGVLSLISSGIADAKRVCIAGWSYGGYAAQVGSFSRPDLYRCAISIAGISDLKAMLEYDKRFYYGSASFKKWKSSILGTSDKKLNVNSVSALKQIKAIASPLLLVHGTKDYIVPVRQSDRLRDALSKNSKTFDYVRIENGAHSLAESEQREKLFNAIEAFLNKYNPAS
jgi:dipeptidyl aminopeptidase/acylaminoacyl peptidase